MVLLMPLQMLPECSGNPWHVEKILETAQTAA